MHGLVLVDVYCLTNVYSNMCNDSSKPINSKKKKIKKKNPAKWQNWDYFEKEQLSEIPTSKQEIKLTCKVT